MRRLAWWIVVIVAMVYLQVVLFARALPPGIWLFLLMVYLITVGMIAGPYFFLARHIDRGRTWAVGGALIFIAFYACATCFAIFHTAVIAPQMPQAMLPKSWVDILLETTILIGHLNLLKLLFKCYSAASRVKRLTLAPVEALPADE